jgi:hypothetical protein
MIITARVRSLAPREELFAFIRVIRNQQSVAAGEAMA